MRHFYGLVFMGNGDLSMRQVRLVHERLEQGFSDLSALQQGAHCMPKAEVMKLEADLQDMLKE
jgi:hypothetical protein